MPGPVDPAELVMNQCVGGGGIGDPQQRLGQTHQRDPLVGAQAVGLQERVEPAGLAGAGTFDQLRRDLAGRTVDRAGRISLRQALGQTGLFLHPIGAAQGGSID